MQVNGMFRSLDIAATGLSAERLRMEVVANNIANANSTRTASGGPYRRQEVLFAPIAAGNDSGGVRINGIADDESELPQVYRPGHPDANGQGMVTMPNVTLPNEMVDLITASRAYEANLRAMRTFRDMAEQTLGTLRSTQ